MKIRDFTYDTLLFPPKRIIILRRNSNDTLLIQIISCIYQQVLPNNANNQVRPEMPKIVTHTHDEDYSDEESDNKSEDKNSPEISSTDAACKGLTKTHPEMPKNVTHTHDEDCSDEETDKQA